MRSNLHPQEAGVLGRSDVVIERVKPTEPAILGMVRSHYSHRSNIYKRPRTVKTSKTWWSNAKLMVFSDPARTFVFAWQWPRAEYRADKQEGFNNTLFHRTDICPFKASEIILAAELAIAKEWGDNRAYSYIDPAETRETKRRGKRVIGLCYLKAGWRFVKIAASGKHLFEKRVSIGRSAPAVPAMVHEGTATEFKFAGERADEVKPSSCVGEHGSVMTSPAIQGHSIGESQEERMAAATVAAKAM